MQSLIRCLTPLTSTWVVRMLGIQVLLVRRFEWLTLFPAWGRLAHTLHFAIIASLCMSPEAVYNLPSGGGSLCPDDLRTLPYKT